MQLIEQLTPEHLAKRKANLERKQRQRAHEKARSHQAIQEHLERVRCGIQRGHRNGKSWREIGAALGQIVKGWERGR